MDERPGADLFEVEIDTGSLCPETTADGSAPDHTRPGGLRPGQECVIAPAQAGPVDENDDLWDPISA